MELIVEELDLWDGKLFDNRFKVLKPFKNKYVKLFIGSRLTAGTFAFLVSNGTKIIIKKENLK